MSLNKSKNKHLNRKWMKSKTLMVSMFLLLTLLVGGTLAYLTDKEDAVINTFKPSKVEITVDEELNDNIKSKVTVKNTGDTEAYIRATVAITWQNETGDVYGVTPVAGEENDYTITWGSENWKKSSDGFYYYKLPVKPNGSTEQLIKEVKSIEGKAPEGYSLNVEIMASAIQSTPIDVVKDNWGVTSDVETIDGKEITVISKN